MEKNVGQIRFFLVITERNKPLYLLSKAMRIHCQNFKYLYAYQGQGQALKNSPVNCFSVGASLRDADPETGKEAFQLRLYDSRINRWLTTDPYGQYSSPYLAMGNNPIRNTDPDGGMCYQDGVQIPCPDTHSQFAGPTNEDAYFDNGKFINSYSLDEVTIKGTNNSGYTFGDFAKVSFENSLLLSQQINIGKLHSTGEYRLYGNNFNTGNEHMKFYNVSRFAQIGGNLYDAAQVTYFGYKAITTEGKLQEKYTGEVIKTTGLLGITRAYPPLGVALTVSSIYTSSAEYKQIVHDARIQAKRDKSAFGPWALPEGLSFNKARD